MNAITAGTGIVALLQEHPARLGVKRLKERDEGDHAEVWEEERGRKSRRGSHESVDERWWGWGEHIGGKRGWNNDLFLLFRRTTDQNASFFHFTVTTWQERRPSEDPSENKRRNRDSMASMQYSCIQRREGTHHLSTREEIREGHLSHSFFDSLLCCVRELITRFLRHTIVDSFSICVVVIGRSVLSSLLLKGEKERRRQ